MKKIKKTSEILPYSCEELPEEKVIRIKESVKEKISVESEEIKMETKKVRRIRPLILAAAIAAMSAVSVLSVNAATDGEVANKIKLLINGKESDIEPKIEENSDGSVSYTYEVNEGDSQEISLYAEDVFPDKSGAEDTQSADNASSAAQDAPVIEENGDGSVSYTYEVDGGEPSEISLSAVDILSDKSGDGGDSVLKS